jgi:DNA polymerase III alpha subunit
MNPEIEAIFYERAKLIHNLDKIVSSASKKAAKGGGMMSMFAEDESYSNIVLDEPEGFDPLAMAEKERDLLGISLLYSEYEPFEAVRCRYCDCKLGDIYATPFEGNKTFLAKLIEIDHKTSSYGNPFAKLKFLYEGTESRVYLFGDLYKKNLLKCFTNKIYLITASWNTERNSLDLVDFMEAKNITNLRAQALWITTNINQLDVLKKYVYCYMMGDEYSVNVKIENTDLVYMNIARCSINNQNLVEMKKRGITVKIR